MIANNKNIKQNVEGNKPLFNVKHGLVTCAVWKNVNAEGQEWYSLSINKIYKDGDEWKKTSNYNIQDLWNIQACINEAYTLIHSLKKEE